MQTSAVSSVKILRASAGSGKTYRLAYEYIKRVVVNPHCYSTILAVTFTNKATEEMKSRILSTLNALANAPLPDIRVDYMEELSRETQLPYVTIKKRADQAKTLILHDYSNFAVSTIDKFFQRIARSFFKELGLDFSYEVELSSDNYLQHAVVNLIERSNTDAKLAHLIGRVVGEQLESNRWNIKDHLVKSGKVLLSESYKEPVDDADTLISIMDLASTAVKDSREAIRQKCDNAVVQISNAGLTPADFKWNENSFVKTLSKIAHGASIAPCGKRLRNAAEQPDKEWTAQKATRKADILNLIPTLGPVVSDIVGMIDQYTVLNNSYTAVNAHFSKFLLLGMLSNELDKLWGQNNRLPIHRTTSLIADIVGSTEIPFIYEKLGARYECYMIDEFQDTSLGQWEGFKPLLSEAISHTAAESVMLIGDVKQAIYRWRGGDWNILAAQAIEQFVGRVDATEQLDTNWRSLPEIVDFNNKLLEKIIALDNSQIDDLIDEDQVMRNRYGQMLGTAYDNFQQKSRPGTIGGYVQVDISDDPIATTLATVDDLLTNRHCRQKDIAILVREKRKGNLIARHLIGAKYNVISDEALYIDSSPAVRFIVSLLKLSIGIEDPITIAHINHYLGYSIDRQMDSQLLHTLRTVTLATPVAALETLLEMFALKDRDTSYIQALYQTLVSFCNNKSADLRQFILWWDESGHKTTLSLPQDQDAITVITIHKAKGLQFPAVIIPWADWNLLPQKGNTILAQTNAPIFSGLGSTLVEYSRAMANSFYNESYVRETIYSHIDNINLLYVALTRAESELYVVTPPTKDKNDNTIAWLINNNLTALDHTSSRVNPQTNLATQFTFGTHFTFCDKPLERDYRPLTFSFFNSVDPSTRMATTLPHHSVTRDADNESLSLTGQHFGLLMHDIFSVVCTAADIVIAIERKIQGGQINKAQAEYMQKLIDKSMSNPLIASWFSTDWQVINERSILTPYDSQTLRPDRVMINDRDAIVVDYKFGKPRSEHATQVETYSSLLMAMGYQRVRRYLWYVMQGTVVEV